MALYQGTEIQKYSATGTDGFATFEGGLQRIHLIADGDCFVDFDRPATTSSLLVKANLAIDLDLGTANVQKVHVVTSGATVNVYILGLRGERS